MAQRSENNSAWRHSASLCAAMAAASCCLCITAGAISGLVYSTWVYDSWIETTAMVISIEEDFGLDFDGDETDTNTTLSRVGMQATYCPEIQFSTLEDANPRNITVVLDTNCVYDRDEAMIVGESVEIMYDPSDPTDVVDVVFPSVIGTVMKIIIGVSALCSSCYVAVGIIAHKAIKARNSRSSYAVNCTTDHANSNDANNEDNPNSTSPSTSHNPSETAAVTAVPVITGEAQVQEEASPTIVSIFPEGMHTSTAIAAGDAAPPLVGATLISDNNHASNQTYVSPSSLPVNPELPTSTYECPSDIGEATASV